MKKRTRRNQALKSIDFLRGFIENRRSKWSKRSYFVPPVHTHADSGIMPGEWSLLVLLHKSLDLSLLTHRDSRCIAGPLGAIPVTYVDASTIFLDLWRAFAFFFFLFLFFFFFVSTMIILDRFLASDEPYLGKRARYKFRQLLRSICAREFSISRFLFVVFQFWSWTAL